MDTCNWLKVWSQPSWLLTTVKHELPPTYLAVLSVILLVGHQHLQAWFSQETGQIIKSVICFFFKPLYCVSRISVEGAHMQGGQGQICGGVQGVRTPHKSLNVSGWTPPPPPFFNSWWWLLSAGASAAMACPAANLVLLSPNCLAAQASAGAHCLWCHNKPTTIHSS